MVLSQFQAVGSLAVGVRHESPSLERVQSATEGQAASQISSIQPPLSRQAPLDSKVHRIQVWVHQGLLRSQRVRSRSLRIKVPLQVHPPVSVLPLRSSFVVPR